MSNANLEGFRVVVRTLLINANVVTRMGNPDWPNLASRMRAVNYESLRKAVVGERAPSEKIMLAAAKALGVRPTVFTEYRLLIARRSLDPTMSAGMQPSKPSISGRREVDMPSGPVIAPNTDPGCPSILYGGRVKAVTKVPLFGFAVIVAALVLGFTIHRVLAGPTVSAADAAHDLQRAGFKGVQILYFTQVDNRDGEIDTINQTGGRRTVLPPVEVIRYASPSVAAHHYTSPGQNYVRRRFVGEFAGRGLAIPRDFHFSPARGLSFRICNVILWSYNGNDDSRLAGRVREAAQLLRRSCHY